MRKFWVFLLAAIAFGLGAFVAVAYSGATGSVASFRIACALLDTAESSGMLDRRQRADIVDRTARELQKAAPTPDPKATELIGQFRTGCPKLPSL